MIRYVCQIIWNRYRLEDNEIGIKEKSKKVIGINKR